MNSEKEYKDPYPSTAYAVQQICQQATRDGAAIWGKSSSVHAEADLLDAVVDSNRQSVDWRVERPQ